MVKEVFRPEAGLTLFLRMRTKEIAKTYRKYIQTEELFFCYKKSRSPKRTARSDFWPEARKLAFLRMPSEK